MADLQSLGANVTRAHYLLNEDLLRRLDRAGIMVWNQAPIWQRDHGVNLLRTAVGRCRALSHRPAHRAGGAQPPVGDHPLGGQRAVLHAGQAAPARALPEAGPGRGRAGIDPTLPISRRHQGPARAIPEQFVYLKFDMLGINQYFGWYAWVSDFNLLEPYLREMRDIYPDLALVMTEFGAEARSYQRDESVDQMGSWAFQAFHLNRTLDVVDRQPLALRRDLLDAARVRDLPRLDGRARATATAPRGEPPNTRHFKGLMTYERRAQARVLRGPRPLRGAVPAATRPGADA